MEDKVYLVMEEEEACCQGLYEVLFSTKVFKTNELAMNEMRELVKDKIKDWTTRPIWKEDEVSITLSFSDTCKTYYFFVSEHTLH